jgi:hypothetical protein
MAKLVFGMNQSLDGYVDHTTMQTGPRLFRHWTEHVGGLAGSVYGRRMYEIMRYRGSTARCISSTRSCRSGVNSAPKSSGP